jgi:hypothetical protein
MTRSTFASLVCLSLLPVAASALDAWQRTPAELATLAAQAPTALKAPIATVTLTSRSQLAASGDPHDYVSYARYYWPDPAKPDGLPYVGRDGQAQPRPGRPRRPPARR